MTTTTVVTATNSANTAVRFLSLNRSALKLDNASTYSLDQMPADPDETEIIIEDPNTRERQTIGSLIDRYCQRDAVNFAFLTGVDFPLHLSEGAAVESIEPDAFEDYEDESQMTAMGPSKEVLPFLLKELIRVPPTLFRTTTGEFYSCRPFAQLVIRVKDDNDRLTELTSFIDNANTSPITVRSKLEAETAEQMCKKLTEKAVNTLIPIEPIPWTEGPRVGWSSQLGMLDDKATVCGLGRNQTEIELPATIDVQVGVNVESQDRMRTVAPGHRPMDSDSIDILRKMLADTIVPDCQGD